jgi:hypothetical protein
MSNSYRIRTQIGVDKSIKVLIDQEFEYLEILSLKVLQSQIYTRQCSDYGVIIGRVSANDGFGIPNAKVSVFIPLTNEDTTNPIISDLYPYKTLSELNEDGYRYNLLPYLPSYSNHSPTGTFFDKHDVLVDPTLIEVYDKYFKYTAKTNDSGDYMIFGVPTGSQTIHVDVDLSDIGEFSLSPQDLIRMGVATPAQVAGTKFKSSANLNELPQIVTINRVIEVEPLWGQPEVCNLGVTRTDFDLTDEANITITPTSIFMGSIISNAETQFQKRSCKPKLKQGNFCSLVAGPGEILAIRQTIAQDINGQPILETVSLEGGGQVIDENGTWLVDVPMNLDYIITNEFGERVLSNDPNKGIPTKGKYRFKVKWNQSPSLSEAIKRGYFLVPNVREYGWTSSDTDPLTTGVGYATAIKSYAFSLDWNDYADVQAAINCEDTFYEMLYNKVYTVSQMIDQYRKGYLPNRMITIKNILDDSCESENVKFPTNDSFLRFDIIYLLFVIAMFVFKPILILLLIISHILAWLLKFILGPILSVVVAIVFTIIAILCPIISAIIDVINFFGANIEKKPCPNFKDMKNLIKKLLTLWKLFTHLRLPNLSYPDCELCACKEGDTIDGDVQDDSAEGVNTEEIVATSGINGILSQYDNATNYNLIHFDPTATYPDAFTSMMSGKGIDTVNPTSQSLVPSLQIYGQESGNDRYMFTSSITLAERINLFNNKAKYFDDFGGANPGGGYNRIKVTFDTSLNASATTYHYDNVVVISCQASQLANFPAGQLISFQDPSLSQDVNLTGFTPYNQYGTRSITGTSINDSGSTITINYSNFSVATGLPVQTTVYSITQNPDDATYAKFPMDAEYFQVITAMTYNTFSGACNPAASDLSLNKRYLYNDMTFTYLSTDNCAQLLSPIYYNPLSIFIDADKQVIVIMVRGVDPYSSRCQNSYDLSVLLGYSMGTAGKTVTGQYKLNHPIQGGIQSVRHTMISDVTSIDAATSEYLYYDSFHFQPALTGPASFSSFTSNFPSYYSSLDNSNLSFTPSSPSLVPSLSVVCQTGLYNASSIKPFVSPQNGFTIEWVVVNPLSGCGPLDNYFTFSGNSYPVDNRGYFVDEIVDGGSVMLQTVTIPVDTITTPTINGYYYAPRYSGTYSYIGLGSSGRQIIMRSDRLPTSTLTLDNAGNSYALQQNANFSAYQIGDDGTVTNTEGIQSNTPSIAEAGPDPVDSSTMTGSVLDTFNCNAMIPLGCYTGATGEFGFYSQPNDCYENGTSNHELIMENGCYVTITKIFLSLGKDIKIVAEWSSRIQITFGACRDVWSHIFTNNWINGTLYAFNIKNDRFFTSPTSTPPNAPYSVYCRDTVILHPTNNFYYRSSPWDGNKFIGADAPNYSAYKGNVKNLKFPTTIMDLGPRSQFLQEIVMSDDYDGYVVKKMGSTTFTDVSEILNLLIISRLANTSFLAQLLGAGGGNILSYFNQRSKLFVDADYAQMISISSELGVADFESANYPSIPGTQDPIYFNGGNSVDGIIGIFFSSDTQVRDFISPKRTIINDEAMVTDTCAFNYFNVFTQSVPFYQWEIKTGDPDSIFGSQSNDWYTNTLSTDFFTHKYQTLDRIEQNSRYFRTNGSTLIKDYKGYIYSVDSLGNYNPSNLSQDPNTAPFNNPISRIITVGAPYHFYFGLKKGKTSFDRFAIKWIGFEIITD